jgi:hypothetical protein
VETKRTREVIYLSFTPLQPSSSQRARAGDSAMEEKGEKRAIFFFLSTYIFSD